MSNQGQEYYGDDYDVSNDEWMLDHFGHTKAELKNLMLSGVDIGDLFDGDPIDLLD